MKLITYYVVISTIADIIAVFICLGIEKVVPWISMPIFLSLFFLILWAAWVAAVKLTEQNPHRLVQRATSELKPPSLTVQKSATVLRHVRIADF